MECRCLTASTLNVRKVAHLNPGKAMNFLEKVERGLERLNRGNVDEAHSIFQDLGSVPPEGSSDSERAKFFEFAGNLAMAQSRFSDAHDAFNFMIRYEERSGESRGGIGNSWGKLVSRWQQWVAMPRQFRALSAA